MKHKLTIDETPVLAKGLKFAVAPERIPHNDFIVATKLAEVELIKQDPNKAPRVVDEIRAEVIGVLSKSHTQKQNLYKDERKQISSLAKRKYLLVLPVNRGMVEVVIDTQVYKDKIKADERVYKIIMKRDLTR